MDDRKERANHNGYHDYIDRVIQLYSYIIEDLHHLQRV